jgi:amylosucrase
MPAPDAAVLPDDVRRSAEQALAGEPAHDRVVVLTRLRRHWPDLLSGLRAVYGARADDTARQAVALALRGFARRPADLRLLDLQRHVEPDWFQSPRMLGYATYADRFAGDLRGVAARVPYLAELGVTYLHLLPLLQSRPGPDDGGYAVQDYRRVRADLGTMDDLEELARVLRASGISLVLDLVLNHVAAEHEWAQRARAGEERYRRYFHLFPDRTAPDAFERTLPEVFPDFAPGSFSWDDEAQAWVWTTFNSWQWDLNWHEPAVLLEFVDLVLFFANAGVEVLRLDAIAFLWKRLGTDCQNQPEVHALTQALRAVTRIAAPSTLFKAEAIVGPQQLVPYLGSGVHAGKVSDLAYHNSLMVQVWSSLAARDARLLTTALRRFPAKPRSTAWGTYLRCHDDIGWAIDDADAAAVGWDGHAHRAFLSDWYCGAFPGSDARGLVFQENPATGDRRISGSAASLVGLEAARESGGDAAVDLAVDRLVVAHLLVLAFGGVPLLWMGDEIALPNDPSWADDPAHEGDNRWAHRPRMPWDVASRRQQPGTVEQRVWDALRSAARTRAGLEAMHASVEPELLDPPADAVVAFVRRSPGQVLVALHNLSDAEQVCHRGVVPLLGPLVDALTGDEVVSPVLQLRPYGALWLVAGSG